MRTFLVLLALSAALLVPAQQDGLKHSPKPKAQASGTEAPLTKAEMKAAFARIEKAMLLLPGLTTRKSAINVPGSGPATREEILLQMDRLFEMCRPHFKFTPPKVRNEPERLTIKSGAARKALDRLIVFGAVARVGPLATSTKPGLQLAEFGDALGFFTARMAELTHTPHSRWTPGMMDRIEDIDPSRGRSGK